jgi:serine/threonine protein kinase
MIKVTIQGRNIEFYPNKIEWYQKRDYYAITTIGGFECFVKKYEGKKPSAWEFIRSVIAQDNTNMPMVYDAIYDSNENSYYVFMECIRGITLKEYILNGDVVKPTDLYQQIEQALSVIHSKGFWFSDFNEENIFVRAGFIKRFMLIDIDSCWHSSLAPNHIPNEQGGIPGASQSIARYILDYYRKYLNQSIEYKDISGSSMNSLQLLFLAIKLNIFKERIKLDQTFRYFDKNSFKELEDIVWNCEETYSKGVFSLAKMKNKNISTTTRELFDRIINKNKYGKIYRN